ncbi:hypothetical protein O181_004562 [Austropuccinia psidii MF-1]|uniref:Uncharacterized protein n=1 Tax=Austropuccinia psidii MF-1 TaxID=1389203 RepID=A0A9Q3GFW9_9BASI|nr:hypothetical protein [Austropuccinia psidii MF-1]
MEPLHIPDNTFWKRLQGVIQDLSRFSGNQEFLNLSDALGNIDPHLGMEFIMIHTIFPGLHDGTSVTQILPDKKNPKSKESQSHDEFKSYHWGIGVVHD